jgi:hypothetical protein
MDADTAETLAGVVRLLRRAAELVWAAVDADGAGSPRQVLGLARLDLPDAVTFLHLSMVASIDIAYVVRDTAADHPGLTAPARIIGMRSQGEAEIAIEQGETRYEGVNWTTRSQIAANQLIPLPEPARRNLINLADDVIATTIRAVAAAAQLDPSDSVQRTKPRAEPAAGRPRAIHGSTSRFESPGGPRR